MRKPKTRIELIQVDALINSSEGNFIYSGILENFFLSKDNGLDRIYLSNVYRRRLKDDLDADVPNVGYLARHQDTRYYSMPGYLFVATYDKIINMNITYYTDLLRLISESQGASSDQGVGGNEGSDQRESGNDMDGGRDKGRFI